MQCSSTLIVKYYLWGDKRRFICEYTTIDALFWQNSHILPTPMFRLKQVLVIGWKWVHLQISVCTGVLARSSILKPGMTYKTKFLMCWKTNLNPHDSFQAINHLENDQQLTKVNYRVQINKSLLFKISLVHFNLCFHCFLTKYRTKTTNCKIKGKVCFRILKKKMREYI